jgi:hypothetical protein
MNKDEKIIEQKISDAKVIVQTVTGYDVTVRNRLRERVNARSIYCKMLFDSGVKKNRIAKSLNQNHATVINAIKILKKLIDTDRDFADVYTECSEWFSIAYPPLMELTREELVSRLNESMKEIRELKDQVEELKKYKIKQTASSITYAPIISAIKNNTPPGSVRLVERAVLDLLQEMATDGRLHP